MINRELLEQTLNKAKNSSCYLAQFKDIDSNSNWLKNWLEYKFPQLTAENCYGKADLDVSLMAVISYCRVLGQCGLNADFALDNIEEFDKDKYHINVKNYPKFAGDWLTSPLHIIKLYMGLMWEKERSDSATEKESYVALYSKTTRAHLLYAPRDTWEKYCYDNADVIWNSFDDTAKKFLINTLSAGNFICMPVYINPCRCTQFGGDDTVDTLLRKMYCCFELSKDSKSLEEYLDKAFVGSYQENARKNVVAWMKLFDNSWDRFIECNLLQKSVVKSNGHYGKPLDLRTGQEIKLETGESYSPTPKSYEECLAMMKNYNEIIEWRTGNIIDCLNKEG